MIGWGELSQTLVCVIRAIPGFLYSIPLCMHLRGEPSDFVHTGDVAIAIALSVFAFFAGACLPRDVRPSHWLLACGPAAAVFAMDGADRLSAGFGAGWPMGLALASVASIFVLHGVAGAASERTTGQRSKKVASEKVVRSVFREVSWIAKITGLALAITLIYTPWYSTLGNLDEDGPLGFALWHWPKTSGGYPPYWDADRIAIEWAVILGVVLVILSVRWCAQWPSTEGSRSS